MTADAQFATSDLRSTLSKFEARAEEAGIEGKEAAKVRREGERERERERGGFFVFSDSTSAALSGDHTWLHQVHYCSCPLYFSIRPQPKGRSLHVVPFLLVGASLLSGESVVFLFLYGFR